MFQISNQTQQHGNLNSVMVFRDHLKNEASRTSLVSMIKLKSTFVIFFCLFCIVNVSFAENISVPVDLGHGMFLLSEEDDPLSTLLEVKVNAEQWEALTTNTSVGSSYGYGGVLRDISKRIYSKFNDDFDFIFFMLNTNGSNSLKIGGTLCHVNNNVQGIGYPYLNNPSEWGSSGKLKSAVYCPKYVGPLLHEVCHNWANYIYPTYDHDNSRTYSGGHWGVSNAGGGVLGGYKYIRVVEENSGGVPGKTLYQISWGSNETNPDGSFKNPDFDPSEGYPCSDIELYLMGMKSAQELRDAGFHLDIYSGNSELSHEEIFLKGCFGCFYSTAKTSYTIDDIIAKHGERIPDVSTSQKQFKVLTVAITNETTSENYCEQIIQEIAWFAGDVDDPPRYNESLRLHNFRQATNNIGSLIVSDVKNSFKLNPSLSLKNIILSAGTLSPAFHPYVFDYNVQVDASIATIGITGISDNPEVEITGNVTALPLTLNGYTYATVTVALPNGDSQSYRISILRGAIPTFTWRIDNAGQTIGSNVIYPLSGASYTIDWGDGNSGSALSHTYNAAGTYQVSIYGEDEWTCPLYTLSVDMFTAPDVHVTQIDVRKAKQLSCLWVIGGEITHLDLSQNTMLTTLGCSSNQLKNLNVNNNTNLQNLDCGGNQLTNLDVSNNTNLRTLSCNVNQLTNLDISNNTKLLSLRCNDNQLTNLDVSNNTELQTLYCGNNLLTKLDVSKNTALKDLDCPLNRLTSLDVSKNTALNRLYCYNNSIPLIDLYKLSQSNASNKYLGQQILPDVTTKTNIPVAIDTVFYGINTVFTVIPTSVANYTLNNGAITFLTPNTYTVMVSNPAIPSGSVKQNFTVTQSTVGISDVLQEKTLQAWIQNGMLHVRGLTVGKTCRVYNALGLLVYQSSAYSEEVAIPLLTRGMYLFQFGNKMVKVIY